MILKVVSLRSRSRDQFYDAVVFVPDKMFMDEIDEVWERMLSQGSESIKEQYGPFHILIKPRKKDAAGT